MLSHKFKTLLLFLMLVTTHQLFPCSRSKCVFTKDASFFYTVDTQTFDEIATDRQARWGLLTSGKNYLHFNTNSPIEIVHYIAKKQAYIRFYNNYDGELNESDRQHIIEIFRKVDINDEMFTYTLFDKNNNVIYKVPCPTEVFLFDGYGLLLTVPNLIHSTNRGYYKLTSWGQLDDVFSEIENRYYAFLKANFVKQEESDRTDTDSDDSDKQEDDRLESSTMSV